MEKFEQNKVEEEPKIELRKAGIDDIPDLLSVENKVADSKTYSAMTSKKEWEQEFAKDNFTVYFIVKDNKIAGDVSYEIDEDGAYISGLVIDPEFQGLGLGHQALQLILEDLKDVKEITLVVHPKNERAIKLYSSFGFDYQGRNENYYGDGEPRDLMIKKQHGTR